MALFGGDGSGSFFSDPTSMAVLGAIAGLGQASGASRLPVTMSSVLGGAAGGFLGGAQAGQEYQQGQQKLTARRRWRM
jgi:hypothetical protein